MKRTASLICILGLILTACQVASSTIQPASAPTPVSPTQGDSQMTPSITTPADTGLQALIERAKENLAQRLGVSADSIIVTSVIGQEFSTDAFNCRQSKERIGREEAPLVVSGYSILLRALGRRYEYHASGQTIIFCRLLP